MAKFLFETTVKCTVLVEADTLEEAMVNVEDLDPCADYCEQWMDQEWTLVEDEEEEPLGSLINDRRHGGPYDRGSADAYYHRPCVPHYYVGATMLSERIEREGMTEEEIEAYRAGYEQQTERKEY